MSDLASFTNPPVVEVVFGVTFNLPERLKAAHVGLFFESVRDVFPDLQEVPPIFAAPPSPLSFLSGIFPLPRTQLISESGSVLMQIQGDKFFFNWKSISEHQQYPSYENILPEFMKYFSTFCAFINNATGKALKVTELELVYVNLVNRESAEASHMDETWLVDFRREKRADRFLPKPSDFRWNTTYPISDGFGTLDVSAYPANRIGSNEPVIRLDVRARGATPRIREGKDSFDQDGLKEWLDVAHKWIVRGFLDLTDPQAQQLWGRKS